MKSSPDPKIPKKTTVFVGMRTSTGPSVPPSDRPPVYENNAKMWACIIVFAMLILFAASLMNK